MMSQGRQSVFGGPPTAYDLGGPPTEVPLTAYQMKIRSAQREWNGFFAIRNQSKQFAQLLEELGSKLETVGEGSDGELV